MAVLRSSIVITYYIKLFRTGADDILMTLLLLAAGMIKNSKFFFLVLKNIIKGKYANGVNAIMGLMKLIV